MKLLLGGCRQRFSLLQSALNGNHYELKAFRDGGQLLQEDREVDDDYDWIILDGRLLKGEREFARLFLQWLGHGCQSHAMRGSGCGVALSRDGTMELSCAMHRMAMQPANSPSYSQSALPRGSFLFEYHAPCGVKR